MARNVTVRLSADISAYITAMGQAEQATNRVADAADRLSDINISTDSSSVASDLDQAASAADSAASSMENAAGSAESMSGGMESAGAAAESTSGGLDSAGASAEVLSSNLDGSGSSAHDFAASLSTVGAQSQDTAAAMLSVSGSAQSAAGGLQEAGAASADVAASVGQVSAASADTTAAMLGVSAAAQDGAAGLQAAGAAGQDAGAGMDAAGAAGQSAGAGLESAGAAAESAGAGLEAASASAEGVGAGMESAGSAAQSVAGDLQATGTAGQDAGAGIESAGASAQVLSSNLDGSGASAQDFAASLSTVGAQSQDAAGAMQSLAGAAQGTAGGFDTAAGSAGTASGAMGDLLSTASGMQSEFRALGGSMAVVGGGLTAMAGHLINVGIEYNNLQQVAGQALTTMAGSAEAAADQMDRLNEFASTSPFFRDTWIEAQRQLMAFGMEAERVVPTLQGIEEAVAAIGGGDQEIRQLVDILGQVEGQGRMTGRELQRLGQMGINAAEIIGEAMGVSGNEIRTQITAGALDAETAITALTDGMSTRFEGSADAIRNTFEGAKNDVIAFTRDIGSIIAAPLVDPAGGGFLVDIANMAGDALLALRELPDPLIQIAGLGAGAMGAVGLLGGAFALAAPQITTFVTGAKNALVALRELPRTLIAAQGGLRRFATTAGIAAAAIGGLLAVQQLRSQFQEAAVSTAELESELLRAAEAGESTQAAFQHLSEVSWFEDIGGQAYRVNDIVDAFDMLHDSTGDVSRAGRQMMDDWWGVGTVLAWMNSDVRDTKEAIAELDGTMAGMVSSGNTDAVVDQMGEFAGQLRAAGYSTEEIAADFPQVIDAFQQYAVSLDAPISRTQAVAWALDGVKPAAVEAAEAADDVADGLSQLETDGIRAAAGMEDLAGSALQVADAVSEAASGLSDMLDGLSALGLIQRDAVLAAYEHEASIRQLDEALASEAERLAELETALVNGEITRAEYEQGVADTTITLDKNTDAGQENAEMLAGIGDTARETAESMTLAGESTDDVAAALDRSYEALVDFIEPLVGTREEAEELANTFMGIDPELDLSVDGTSVEFAKLLAEGLGDELDGVEGIRTVEIEAVTEAAELAIQQFETGDYQTMVDILGDDELAQQVVYDFQSGEYVATADIDGNTEPAAEMMAAFINGDHQTVADILGEDEDAREVMRGFLNEYWSTTAEIDGDDNSARGTMHGFIDSPWNTTADIHGEDSSARGTMGNFLGTRWSTTADIDGNDGPARNTMGNFIGAAWGTTVSVSANTSSAQSAIARLSGQSVTVNVQTAGAGIGRGAGRLFSAGGLVRRATGGMIPNSASLNSLAGGYSALPGYSNGGQLPYTGLGTDKILGINADGLPVAWVDDGEFITRESQTRRHRAALEAINDNNMPALKHYVSRLADGGIAGAHQPRSFAAAQAPVMPAPTPPAVQAAPPSELTGTLYMENGALLGEVRMAMRDPGVVREASQSLARQGARDRRAG